MNSDRTFCNPYFFNYPISFIISSFLLEKDLASLASSCQFWNERVFSYLDFVQKEEIRLLSYKIKSYLKKEQKIGLFLKELENLPPIKSFKERKIRAKKQKEKLSFLLRKIMKKEFDFIRSSFPLELKTPYFFEDFFYLLQVARNRNKSTSKEDDLFLRLSKEKIEKLMEKNWFYSWEDQITTDGKNIYFFSLMKVITKILKEKKAYIEASEFIHKIPPSFWNPARKVKHLKKIVILLARDQNILKALEVIKKIPEIFKNEILETYIEILKTLPKQSL